MNNLGITDFITVITLLIQQMPTEHLLCDSHCAQGWIHKDKQDLIWALRNLQSSRKKTFYSRRKGMIFTKSNIIRVLGLKELWDSISLCQTIIKSEI